MSLEDELVSALLDTAETFLEARAIPAADRPDFLLRVMADLHHAVMLAADEGRRG